MARMSHATPPRPDAATAAAPKPLDGVRVIELTQVMAGPTCGLMLADLGADVIKVERHPHGDDTRAFGGGGAHGITQPFVMMNRNKRGVRLNLREASGREQLAQLLDGADVLLENHRPGTLAKFGFSYEAVHARWPRVIYASITGWGGVGPFGQEGGYDMIAQAFAGIMSVTGTGDGKPVRPGPSLADVNAGLLATVGILAALRQRETSGTGQLVQTSLLEAALQQQYWYASVFFETGKTPPPAGSAHPLSAPYQAFRAADGYLVIGGGNQANWERVAQVLGHPEWVHDPRFVDNTSRKRHDAELAALIEAVLADQPVAHWLERLRAADVPAGPVNDLPTALDNPQTAALGMVQAVRHPQAGEARVLGLPLRFSSFDARSSRPAPLLGEHNDEVLGDARTARTHGRT